MVNPEHPLLAIHQSACSMGRHSLRVLVTTGGLSWALPLPTVKGFSSQCFPDLTDRNAKFSTSPTRYTPVPPTATDTNRAYRGLGSTATS